jgi:hypothetical protein
MDSELIIAITVVVLLAAALAQTADGLSLKLRGAVGSEPALDPASLSGKNESLSAQSQPPDLEGYSAMRVFLIVQWRSYFARPSGPQSAGGIIKWWEARRLRYNLIVFLAILLAALASSFDELDLSPLPYLRAVSRTVGIAFLVLQLPANLWYTGGWVVDLIIKKWLRRTAPGFGPWAQGIGIGFSLVFVGFMMLLLAEL